MTKLLYSITILIFIIYFGNRTITINKTCLPPIGKFISPSTGFWLNGNHKAEDDLLISSLSTEAKIFQDDRGVPHLFAADLNDAARVQGYLHARDRLFQMDMSSRFTAGRLSELLGDKRLPLDKIMRRRGLAFAAENAIRGWKQHEETWNLIVAYTEGVNTYIDNLSSRNIPVEYKLINGQVERWTAFKTACINKSMTFDLCFRNEDDKATQSRDLVGEEYYDILFPLRSKKDEPIIPVGTPWATNEVREGGIIPNPPGQAKPLNNKLQTHLPPESNGSNNWAVNGTKTKSGYPILCNDPHLALRLPSVWYELQMHTPEFNVYGVSLPGAPGVIIGFNEHIAWGVTNVGMDVVDWYKIELNSNKTSYTIDNKSIPIQYRIETIHSRSGRVLVDSVPYTQWGPMTYSDDSSHYLHQYALRWVGHDEQEVDELGCFIGLNKAKNLSDYVEATQRFRSPAQNIACATKEGDIALRISGAIPIRNTGSGQFLGEGHTTKNAWAGFVPASKNPMTINPARGFISSANQISTDSTYPYAYHGYYDDFRGRLLNRKLASMSDITPQDMMRLQNNDESLIASEGLPALLNLLNVDELSKDEKARYQELINWDMHFRADEIAPAYFMEWFIKFYDLLWDELQNHPSKLKTPEYWKTIVVAESEQTHPYFDRPGTTKIENANDIATLSFQQMNAKIDSLIELDPTLTWGMYNNNRVTHLTGLAAFSSAQNQVNGSKYSLCAVSAKHGPSWRMVVELGDPIRAWGVYPGGQSGHPGHQHYKDMIETWSKGDYYQLDFIKDPTSLNNKTGKIIVCQSK